MRGTVQDTYLLFCWMSECRDGLETGLKDKSCAHPSKSSSSLHAQLQSWATRVGGCVGSTLVNGVSSHRFSGMLTTKDIDAFCQLAAIATTSSHHGCIASDGVNHTVLSANVNTTHTSNRGAVKRGRVGAEDSADEHINSDAKRQRFGETAAGAGMQALQNPVNENEFNPHVLRLAKSALSALAELRGPHGEVAVEGTALHAHAGDAHKKGASNLLVIPNILLVRLCAGIPLAISQLRAAVGGDVWADGTFRVVPRDEQQTLEHSLPALEARAKLAAAQTLLPLVAGFSVPDATSATSSATSSEPSLLQEEYVGGKEAHICHPTPKDSPRGSPTGAPSRSVRSYMSPVI